MKRPRTIKTYAVVDPKAREVWALDTRKRDAESTARRLSFWSAGLIVVPLTGTFLK